MTTLDDYKAKREQEERERYMAEWVKQDAIRTEVEPYIKEAKLKGDTYAKITEHIQKSYPEITASLVSKWGKKMLGSMSNYRKNPDGSVFQDVYYLRVDKATYDAFQEARERLKVDLNKEYAPTDRATIMDLINKT